MENQESTQLNTPGSSALATDSPTANSAHTLVGNKADTKQDHTPKEEPKAPEEILYSWEGPEFAYTEKPTLWYAGTAGVSVVLIGLAFWLISSPFQKYSTMLLLVLVGVATAVWANRKPKTLAYQITNYGITIDSKAYLYDDFRSFYEYMDYNQPSIDLIPAKRFGTLVTLPLATPDADVVKDTIAQMVPKVEHNEDIVDKLFRRLRF